MIRKMVGKPGERAEVCYGTAKDLRPQLNTPDCDLSIQNNRRSRDDKMVGKPGERAEVCYGTSKDLRPQLNAPDCDLSSFYKNENGMALIMVMTSITFLILVLATFTYDTKVNKLRLYNRQDRIQAKLNAQSGLEFALVRLEIYQKARNLLEQNESLKDMLTPQLLQSILIMPFIYPVPAMGEMNIIQRDALAEFNKNILLGGELSLAIAPQRGYLNPNNMILKSTTTPNNPLEDTFDANDNTGKNDDKTELSKEIEKEIISLLAHSMEQKRETDELFNSLYANLDPKLLVKELKYYITPKGEFKDAEIAEIQPLFDNQGITPKYAPLSSIEELNLLPSWDDAIIDLVKENLTVHMQKVLNVETISKKQLLAIFPTLTPKFADDYFEYIAGNEQKEIEPHPIKSVARFEEVLTRVLSLVQPEDYKASIKKLKTAGISLGVANLLFKVKSIGTFNRSKYSLTAIINIPTLEIAPKKSPTPTKPKEEDPGGVFNPDGTKLEDNPNDSPSGDSDKEAKKKIEYLAPRVVEINNN